MEINPAAYNYGRGVINTLKKNWKMLFSLIFFAVGLILGAIIIKNNNSFVIDTFMDMFKTYISVKKEQSIGLNFINSLTVNLAFILFSFILGLCAVGLPLISVLPLIKGIGIGMLSGFLYSNFALSGLGYCVLIIYPGLIPATFALMLSCSTGISSSYNMLFSLSSSKSSKGELSLKFYCLKFLVIALITVFSSAIDAIVVRLFSSFFNF